MLESADRLVWSERPVIVARGLEPGADYTLTTERQSYWDAAASERSELVFTADARGMINTGLDPVKGRTEPNPYTPIQSMLFLRGEALDGVDPLHLRFSLRDIAGKAVASRTVPIGPDPDTLVETPLGADFPGAYVLRRADREGPSPVIVVLGGSEGGDRGSRSIAPLFAAEGYTVLGLPYYSPAWFGQTAQFPDLPRAFADLPVDYLEQAVAEVRTRPDVDPDRISLHGGSKGAEFVLLAGALIPDDSPGGGFCGIVADVPSDVVWEGWGAGKTVSSFSWRGERLPFVPYKDMGRALDRSDAYTMAEAHENGLRDNPGREEAARIPVARIDEPVLLIGGDKDTTWASGRMARAIERTRIQAGLQTESYVYPDGSHGAGGTPLVRTSEANLMARLENFPATMAFHARNSKRDDCRS